jgi:phosphotransferase system enzyme I (PtsI)
MPISEKEPRIFLTKSLDMIDYKIISACKAVVCEYAGKTTHITVLCRIRGIPIIEIKDATLKFNVGQEITVDFINEKAYSTLINLPQKSFVIPEYFWPETLTYQLSIVDSSDIEKIKKISNNDVEIFFIRSEFIWLLKYHDPFSFLKKNGFSSTVKFLFRHYKKYVAILKSTKLINIRSLDMRTDEFNVFGTLEENKELNPQLGNHGIRRLLSSPQLLIAELMAIDALYSMGYENIVFSLPFVTYETEVRKVKDFINIHCKNPIKLGVFIETPAAISELPFILKLNIHSIYVGTKDLTQLTLGVDRGNKNISHLYQQCSRAVLDSIQRILDVCNALRVFVSVFSLPEDVNYYCDHLTHLDNISLCCSDYLTYKNKPDIKTA